MLTYRSGWIGVSSHTNIIEFLYYSYLFNPVYVKMIQYHQQGIDQSNSVKLYYTPMTFKQAFFAAFNYRGFDPIVLKGELQLKRFKRRKMLMPTLISECFQQINGPIMLFLPGFGYKQQLGIHQVLGQDIYDNQKKFLRSGVLFASQIQQYQAKQYDQNGTQMRKLAPLCQKIYPSQITFIAQVCSQMKINFLITTANQTIKHKYQYNRGTCADFINQVYLKNKFEVIDMKFQRYLQVMDQIEQELKKKQMGLSVEGNKQSEQTLRQEHQSLNSTNRIEQKLAEEQSKEQLIDFAHRHDYMEQVQRIEQLGLIEKVKTDEIGSIPNQNKKYQ